MPSSSPSDSENDGDGVGEAGGGAAAIVTRKEVTASLTGLAIVVLTLILGRVNSSIVLITSSNDSVPFPDVEASFSHRIPGAGIVGVLFAASPLNACVPLIASDARQMDLPAFVLIERGDCNFVMKVKYAQDAGYAAAIIYNNEDGNDLVTMSGNGVGINIPAVLVSNEAGSVFLQYAGDTNARVYMLPAFENTIFSVMAISFISLLAVSAVLSTFLFVRRQRLRRMRRILGGYAGMSHADVKALPVSIFNPKENATPESCTICLEEYANGEKLRLLPCSHEFHMECIDRWLTTRRPFCPICKRDAHLKNRNLSPSEQTPLLNSISLHVASTMTSLTSTPAEVSNIVIGVSTLDSAGDVC